MLAYFFASVATALTSFSECFTKTNPVRQRRILLILIIGFAMLSSIRWGVGTDWDGYLNDFIHKSHTIKSTWIGDSEVGIRVLSYIVRQLGGNFATLNIVYSVIVGVSQYKAISYFGIEKNIDREDPMYSKTSSCTILMMLWFIYFCNVFTTRSTIAYSVLLLSMVYADNKEFGKFIFCVVAASLLHKTSIIFIVAYPVFNSRWKIFRKFYKYMPCFLIGFGLISGQLINVALKILPATFTYKINFYLNDPDPAKVTFFGIANYIFLVTACYFLLVRKKCDTTTLKFYNLFCVGLFPYVFGIMYSAYFVRMGWPFMMSAIFLLPAILNKFKRVRNKVMVFCVLMVYLSLRLRQNINSYYDLYVPFKTIFGKQ